MAVVVITGCSSGLGAVAAVEFARRGHRVYATMRSAAARGGDLADRAADEDLDIRVVDLDVTSDRSVRQAVDDILAAEGRIDVVVNNAGLGHLGAVELLDDDALRETFETNVYGPVRVLRAVLPAMRAAATGIVVNVSSIAGRVAGLPIFWSYMASKHALSVLSDSLAVELEGHGIRVVCIEPGFFRTPIMDKARRAGGESSPYRTYETAVGAFLDNGVATGADPTTVARAVVDAAEEGDGRVHIPVGDDADFFLSQYQSSTDTEMAAFYKEILGITAAASVAGAAYHR